MAIEWIGNIALQEPQHIEDKLAALAEKATPGARAIKGAHIVQIIDGRQGQTIADYCPWIGTPNAAENAALHVALNNAATALLAVVRAARRMARCSDPLPVLHEGLREALAALDAVEV